MLARGQRVHQRGGDPDDPVGVAVEIHRRILLAQGLQPTLTPATLPLLVTAGRRRGLAAAGFCEVDTVWQRRTDGVLWLAVGQPAAGYRARARGEHSGGMERDLGVFSAVTV
jgi:hypothetical protein